MASTDKTPILGLSKWRGSDKPKRVDFVNDNEVIDAALGGHVNNTDLHLNSDQALRLNQPICIKTITGTGSPERSVVLDFEPAAAVAFAVGKPPVVQNGAQAKVYSAFCAQEKNGAGIELYFDEVRLLQNTAGSGGVQNCLNESGVTYVIMAFR